MGARPQGRGPDGAGGCGRSSRWATPVGCFPASGTGLPAWLRPGVLGLGIVAVAALAAASLFRAGPVAQGADLAGGRRRDVAGPARGLGVGGHQHARTVRHTLPVGEDDRTSPEPSSALRSRRSRRFLGSSRSGTAPPISWRPRPRCWRRPSSSPQAKRCCPSVGSPATSPPRRSGPWLRLVAAGAVPPRPHRRRGAHDPRVVWMARHCIKVPASPATAGSRAVLPVGIYYCSPPR